MSFFVKNQFFPLQKGYLQVTVNEQSVVPYDQMFPFLFPVIDQYKAGELKDLFDKYKVCYPQTGFTIYHFFSTSLLC
jgi:hypothetical protein